MKHRAGEVTASSVHEPPAQVRRLTAQFKEVANIMELLLTHRAHERHLNHIHLSASWTSFGQLVRNTISHITVTKLCAETHDVART